MLAERFPLHTPTSRLPLAGLPDDQGHLGPWAEMVGEVIERAHAVSPSSWCLTLEKGRRYLTLNVGRVFVIRAWKDRVLVIVSRSFLEAHPEVATALDRPGEMAEFASLPGYTTRTGSFEGVARVWPELREDMFEAVRAAAAACPRTPYARAHSKEAVAAVEGILGRTLPRPGGGGVAINRKALEALIEDLHAVLPGFTTFADRDGPWWRSEREYKLEMIEVFRDQFGAEVLREAGTPDGAEDLRDRVEGLLLRKLPRAGDPQNLVSWKLLTFLKPLKGHPELKIRFAQGLADLLLGAGPSEERAERFSSELQAVITAVEKKSNAATCRSLPTVLLMLQDLQHEILIRTEELRRAAKALTGEGILGEGPLTAEEYRRARDFARSLFQALEAKGLEPVDMLTVQGFLHVTAARGTWILQASPKIYDLAGFLRDGHREATWLLPTRADGIREQDEVHLWLSGENRGIVATGRMLTPALDPKSLPAHEEDDDESSYYADGVEPRTGKAVLRLSIDHAFPDRPLRAADLLEHPTLRGLSILRQPQGTLFSVVKEQAVALRLALREHMGAVMFDDILDRLDQQGLYFPTELVADYLLALQTKRFVILTGISGTGKTKLAMAVAEAFPVRRRVTTDTVERHGAARITVQPYMRKYSRFVVPAAVAKLAPWELSEGARSMGQVTVRYGERRATQSFYRAPDRPVTILLFSGVVREWFLENFPEGSQFDVDLEAVDGEQTVLSIQPVGAAAHEEVVVNRGVVAVRPDWTDHRGLLGYFNPLTGRYVRTPFLELLMEAGREAQRAEGEGREAAPFFAVLDEMNLARVEHYFSDLLSCMESGEAIHLHDDHAVAAGETEDEWAIPKDLPIPPNLFVTGTVNVDETTYMFSPKVLDRAFTIELNEVDLAGYAADGSPGAGAVGRLRLPRFHGLAGKWSKPETSDWEAFGELPGGWREKLVTLNRVLEAEGRHFGYRVANEIGCFVNLAAEQGDGTESTVRAAFDLAVLQKVLPKLHGTQQELQEVIHRLFEFAVDPEAKAPQGLEPTTLRWVDGGFERADGRHRSDEPSPEHITAALPRTARQLWRMARRLQQRGFVSYIE